MRYTITGDDGREYWTMAQCLEHTQVTKGTWSAYVTRAQAPAPAGHLNPRTPLWDASEVRVWHAARPSQRRG